MWVFNNVQNDERTLIDDVWDKIGERYKGSEGITIARCNMRNVDANPVHCLPTIKLYPAKVKNMPVEYIPDDYSSLDGYTTFIQQEGSNHVQCQKA